MLTGLSKTHLEVVRINQNHDAILADYWVIENNCFDGFVDLSGGGDEFFGWGGGDEFVEDLMVQSLTVADGRSR